MPSRVSPARDASGARGTPLNRREVISLLPRLREEGRRRAASRSIAIETPKSASRVHPAHCPHPQTQEDALLREQIDKHGGPGNWTAIAEALVGRSSKSCRLRCARLRTHPRARDAAGIAVRSPRAPPVISRRAARAFPGLILERRPPHPLASPRVPSPFLTNRSLLFSLLFPFSLFLPNTRRWCNQLNPTVKRGPFTEEEDKEILAAHAVYGNKWAVISRGIPGRYGRDARAPRHTPKPRFNTLGTDSRDSVRSFRRADAEPSFVVHAPRPGTFARFFKNPPRGSSEIARGFSVSLFRQSRSWENLARGFSVSLFRQSDECLFFATRPRRA